MWNNRVQRPERHSNTFKQIIKHSNETPCLRTFPLLMCLLPISLYKLQPL